MVGHIEEGAVRGQRTAPGLGADSELSDHRMLVEVDDGNGAADGVRDISRPVTRVDGDTAGLFAYRDFGDLVADILAVCILHPDDRNAVRRAIDDDQTLLVAGQRDSGRAGR